MATYSASDFIGKTIYITATVPVYKYAVAQGTKKPSPIEYLKSGDGFTVDSYINQKGAYTTFIDNYWQGTSQGKTFVIAFKDIAGKYNASAILSQGGIKSDEQKVKEVKQKEDGTILTLIKKIAPFAIGVYLLGAYIGRRK
jgi:hypothetical protein